MKSDTAKVASLAFVTLLFATAALSRFFVSEQGGLWRLIQEVAAIVSALCLALLGGRFHLRRQLPKPVRVVVGLIIVAGIFYGARVIFNSYYAPLAQATDGLESSLENN